MSPLLRVGGRSDVGLHRHNNQDSMYAGPHLIAVADGVGGAAGGEVASRLTITALTSLDTDTIDDPNAAFRAAAEAADAAIRSTVTQDAALAGMSTTLTAMLATNDQLVLAHIGDSRAYLLRHGVLSQLTHDHTLVQSLIDEGQITEEEALTHPRRSWIMRALDGRGQPALDLTVIDLEPGDRLLVCSDGLSSYVSEPDIAAALGGDDPQLAADRLVDLALQAGGPDNITCVVADPIADDGSLVGQAPILGGAVAEAPPASAGHETTSVPSAAEAGDAPAPPTVARSNDASKGDDGEDETRHRRSLGRRLAAVACLVVIVIAAVVAAVAVYIHRQWYIAPSGGNVAIYQGTQGSAAGIHLSHLHALTNIPVTALPQDDQANVRNGIQAAGGETGATTVVNQLRHDACVLATPSPTPTATPVVTTKATPKTSRSPKGARHTPKPTPTPAWCVNPQ